MAGIRCKNKEMPTTSHIRSRVVAERDARAPERGRHTAIGIRLQHFGTFNEEAIPILKTGGFGVACKVLPAVHKAWRIRMRGETPALTGGSMRAGTVQFP